MSTAVEKKTAARILIVVFFFSLGAALFVNILEIQKSFLFADEAVYYFITQSIAFDGDLEYTKKDIYRYRRNIDAGPLGIFLKKGKNDRIFFAKSFVYPLFAAPFVRIFGINGFLVFHAVLLGMLLWMGWTYLSAANRPLISLAAVLTFLFASVAIVYFIWIHPDFFNLFLIFSVLFLWIYKHRASIGGEPGDATWLRRFLLSDASDYAAAVLAGIAIFAKPPNVAVLGPIVLFYLLKKRFRKAALIVFFCLLAAGLFFGLNALHTGDWNYQGGERKAFYGKGGFPLEKPNLTFEKAKGNAMSTEGYADAHLLPFKAAVSNLFYSFFGRFTGVTWYFFPAVLFLILFLIRKKQLYQWLIFIAIFGEILIYIIMMPDNYGGGACVGNRYFLSIYPFFFFLAPMKVDVKRIAACWIAASLFIAPILVNPFFHSHYPDTHAKKPPFTWLPPELTLHNNFPTNTNPWAFRQQVYTHSDKNWIHFLDDNFLPRFPELNEKGFWTRGSHRADMLLKTYYPVKEVRVRLMNNRRISNTITVRVGGRRQSVVLGQKQWGELIFFPKPWKMESWHLYRVKIKAAKGSLPYLEEEASMERRNLGVYFELELFPEESGPDREE